jgi:hypothetical protein
VIDRARRDPRQHGHTFPRERFRDQRAPTERRLEHVVRDQLAASRSNAPAVSTENAWNSEKGNEVKSFFLPE